MAYVVGQSSSMGLTTPTGYTFRLRIKVTEQYGMYNTVEYELSCSEITSNDWGTLTLIIDGDRWAYPSYNASGFNNKPGSTLTGQISVERDVATNIGKLSISLEAKGWYTTAGQSGSTSYTKTSTGSWSIGSNTVYSSGAQIGGVTDFTDETSPVITYSYDRGSSASAASLFAGISFTSAPTMNIPYREITDINGSYTFTFTDEEKETLYTLLRKGTSATVKFYIKTTETLYSGEVTHIENSFTKTFNFINYTPIITPTIQDINPNTIALTGDANKLIRYMSKVSYDMDVQLRKGGLDIIGCYIQNGDKIEEGFLEGTFDNPTSNTFYFSATDDRGYTGTTSYALDMFHGDFVSYVKLTSNVKSTPIRAAGDLDITVSGKYFSGWFSENNPNTLSIKYKIYQNGEVVDWVSLGEISPTIDGSDYTYTFTPGGLDYTKQYNIEVQAIDRLMTSSATIKAVAKPVFYWGSDAFMFNVPVTIDGASVDSIVEEDTATGYYMSSSGSYSSGGFTWTYRKWASGLLECWCSVPLTTTVNTAWGSMYTAATQYKTDLAYPVPPKETPLIIATIGAGATKGMLIADNSYAADNISTGRYNIASPVAITSSTTFRINYYVRGKWK